MPVIRRETDGRVKVGFEPGPRAGGRVKAQVRSICIQRQPPPTGRVFGADLDQPGLALRTGAVVGG